MTTIVRSIVYTCARCRAIFESEWDDREAERELQKTFPGATREECEVLCTDCYESVLKEIHAGGIRDVR